LDERVERRKRVVAVQRRVGVEVVVRRLRALRPPVAAVTGPGVDDRRLVAEAPKTGHERRHLAERSDERDHVRLLLRDLADYVADRLVEGRELLLVDDLAAELLEPRLEGV